MELISVVVPIYKVEKYLDECVNSLVNQTYSDLEIILVDDGSPDNCPQMCDEWANKDNRIRVVHKANGGLSDARNAGMKVAKGAYICFVDSDDYVSPDFIEVLYNTMQNEESDIVECEVLKFQENEKPDFDSNDFKAKTFHTQDAVLSLINEKEFHQHVWNKLYKADIVLNVFYEKGKLNEDEFWTYQVFGQAIKITKITKPMYFYRQRESSIMGASYSIRRLDALEAKAQRQEYIQRHFPEIAGSAKVNLFGSCIFSMQSVMRYMKDAEKKKAKQIIKSYVKQYKLNKQELDILTGKNKLWFNFAARCFSLCCFIRCQLGIGF